MNSNKNGHLLIFLNVYYVSSFICVKEYPYIIVGCKNDLLAHNSVNQQFGLGSAVITQLILSCLTPAAALALYTCWVWMV